MTPVQSNAKANTRAKTRRAASLTFQEIPGMPDISEARGKTLSMFAIALKSGGVCIVSPLAGQSAMVANAFGSRGEVSALLAPNHYHNKGLQEYAVAFPNARLFASPMASPRLTKITGLSFADTDLLSKDLPKIMDVLEPEGLKTGECWIRVRGRSELAWLVTDAFCGPSKANGMAVHAELLKTFPKYGLADRSAYTDWATEQIKHDHPTMLLTCHGSSVQNEALGSQLLKLVSQL